MSSLGDDKWEKIRPLFLDIWSTRKPCELMQGWDASIRQIPFIQLSDEGLQLISDWVRWYVETVDIVAFSADSKLVAKQLAQIERHAVAMLQRPTSRSARRLAQSMTYPVQPRSEAEKAKGIALDYLERYPPDLDHAR